MTDYEKEIYLSGMINYESICEKLLSEKYEDALGYNIQENVLDEAQRIFEAELN